MQPRYEIGEVLACLGEGIEALGLNTWQLRTFRALRQCRTGALGGHIDHCGLCGHLQISYNSCRNRHCPKCQGQNREQWIAERMQEILPAAYFHVVFTLPDVLNLLAMHQPKAVYDALFASAWQTLNSFGRNKGVQLGMIAVLHTWGQTLSLHPHLHCIVPGGGVTSGGQWKNLCAKGKFLFAVKAMAKVFRAKYVAALSAKLPLDPQLRQQLFAKPWVVYAKRPFGTPYTVVEYLGRYTHKVAISNHRLVQIDAHTVSFRYKDYRQAALQKTMQLTHAEFIRRFALHILPKRFVKIRHYGILSSTWKRSKFRCLQNNTTTPPPARSTKPKHPICPCCKIGKLHTIIAFDGRGPPETYCNAVLPKPACQA